MLIWALKSLSLLLTVAVWLAPSFVQIFIAGACFQLFFVRKANESNFIDSLLKQLEDLKADSLEYWNLDEAEVSNVPRCRILAQKIKGGIRAVNADILCYRTKYKPEDGDEFVSQVQTIFYACTSGEFEGATKQVDCERYILIVNAINKLKSQLLRRKL